MLIYIRHYRSVHSVQWLVMDWTGFDFQQRKWYFFPTSLPVQFWGPPASCPKKHLGGGDINC